MKKTLLVLALVACAGTAWAGTCGTNVGRNSNTSSTGHSTGTQTGGATNDNAGLKH